MDLTCFLEYLPSTVNVHDIVYTRDANGWRMKKSAYAKLRLPQMDVAGWQSGFALVEQVAMAQGVIGIVAR
jgi:hypothetical protein